MILDNDIGLNFLCILSGGLCLFVSVFPFLVVIKSYIEFSLRIYSQNNCHIISTNLERTCMLIIKIADNK